MPPGVLVAAMLLAFIVVAAVLAPWIAPHDPSAQHLGERLVGPSSEYLLGSDHLGRDVLSRVLSGARVSLTVAALAVVISGTVGVLLGIWGGYVGGRVDAMLSWLANVQLAFPLLLLAVTLAAVIGGSIYGVVVVLAATAWSVYARVVRAQTLTIKNFDYVHAAELMQAGRIRIMLTHILPSVWGTVIAVSTIEAANMIILEAGLSFLGLGVPPGTPSWGAEIAEGVLYLERAWWISAAPGVALTVTVMSMNVVGNWLTDAISERR